MFLFYDNILSMASFSRSKASSKLTPSIWVAALARCPPPPSSSIINWTFIFPNDLAEIPTFPSSKYPIAKLHSIPLRDSEALNNALKNKTLIALASDHHADDVEIEFFGRKTTAVSGPVLLGLKHKIPLVLSYAIFEGNTVKVINKKILEIEKKENLKATVKYNMQKIFYEFEEIIKEYPEQYMWQHKRWRDE